MRGAKAQAWVTQVPPLRRETDSRFSLTPFSSAVPAPAASGQGVTPRLLLRWQAPTRSRREGTSRAEDNPAFLPSRLELLVYLPDRRRGRLATDGRLAGVPEGRRHASLLTAMDRKTRARKGKWGEANVTPSRLDKTRAAESVWRKGRAKGHKIGTRAPDVRLFRL